MRTTVAGRCMRIGWWADRNDPPLEPPSQEGGDSMVVGGSPVLLQALLREKGRPSTFRLVALHDLAQLGFEAPEQVLAGAGGDDVQAAAAVDAGHAQEERARVTLQG